MKTGSFTLQNVSHEHMPITVRKRKQTLSSNIGNKIKITHRPCRQRHFPGYHQNHLHHRRHHHRHYHGWIARQFERKYTLKQPTIPSGHFRGNLQRAMSSSSSLSSGHRHHHYHHRHHRQCLNSFETFAYTTKDSKACTPHLVQHDWITKK